MAYKIIFNPKSSGVKYNEDEIILPVEWTRERANELCRTFRTGLHGDDTPRSFMLDEERVYPRTDTSARVVQA